MMKRPRNTAQSGFALIDVMIATVVLAVGVVAFLKLQNIGLQRSAQSNYRLQATASAEAMIELMRGNRHLLTWASERLAFVSENHEIEAEASTTERNCTGAGDGMDNPDNWCASDGESIQNDLLTYATAILSENFNYVAGKAVMCALTQGTDDDELVAVRIVVIWKNATPNAQTKYQVATAGDCPDYGGAVDISYEDTTSPDSGYIEIFTRI